ncbi:potassium/sodium hyperpolarization-activated cyclic nucleotide-gated channel 2 [Triticum aestivum]|uniref:potassium/sodium hyperpolarization-activated cyclic nucleotide-gated channel 2 n=1 Tax=Triticum aestivum TaxID=4565 RepID=UPI001D00EFE1|nr:potassium/sodium hyperpolarization-activated cyclic nucleotide-gated channel 2-like [Triticum aestivum]
MPPRRSPASAAEPGRACSASSCRPAPAPLTGLYAASRPPRSSPPTPAPGCGRAPPVAPAPRHAAPQSRPPCRAPRPAVRRATPAALPPGHAPSSTLLVFRTVAGQRGGALRRGSPQRRRRRGPRLASAQAAPEEQPSAGPPAWFPAAEMTTRRVFPLLADETAAGSGDRRSGCSRGLPLPYPLQAVGLGRL